MSPISTRNVAQQRETLPTSAEADEVVPETQQPSTQHLSVRIRPPSVAEAQPAEHSTGSPRPTQRSTPTVHHAVSYGQLNSHEPMFFFRSTVPQLKAILASAPPQIRPRLPTTATKDNLLEELFRLRQNEAEDSACTSEEAHRALRQLMDMSTQEVANLAAMNGTQLKAIMVSALNADSKLVPRNLESRDPHHLAMIALSWKLEALQYSVAVTDQPPPSRPFVDPNIPTSTAIPQSARPPVRRPNIAARYQAASRIAHQPSQSFIPQGPPAHDDHPTDLNTLGTLIRPIQPRPIPTAHEVQTPLSDSDDGEHIRSARKRSKSSIQPKFQYGVLAAQSDLILHYPGKGVSSSSLHVDYLWGPNILCNMIAGGVDIPTFLSQFQHWKKLPSGQPTHAEMEAHCLGRAIHVEMLEHETPKEAFENRPSLEIQLRRLYALLYVEEEVNTNRSDRGSAWKQINSLHESVPRGTIMCDQMNEEVTRRMSLERKRLAALQAMNEHKASVRRNRNPVNPSGESTPNAPNHPPATNRRSG